jgi:hypothetical protein
VPGSPPPAFSIWSASFFAMGIAICSLPARKPHMPSMPEHCCTSFTLAPVSFMRSRLLNPMFWARRWHAAW